MTDPGRRFCPRCGFALVPGFPFCPSCGFNSDEVGDRPRVQASPSDPYVDVDRLTADPIPSARTRPDAPDLDDTRSTIPTTPAAVREFVDRAPRGAAIVFGALVIAAGLIVFALLTRPQPGVGPPAARQGGSPQVAGSPGGPTLIAGLTIQSPINDQEVATKEVTVIGLAPPGLTITRDVSFGLDQHATADGTGHWAIVVGLNEGENKLKFRIGDDRSTEVELRVTYTPPAAP
jgi:hypothetical protein